MVRHYGYGLWLWTLRTVSRETIHRQTVGQAGDSEVHVAVPIEPAKIKKPARFSCWLSIWFIELLIEQNAQHTPQWLGRAPQQLIADDKG